MSALGLLKLAYQRMTPADFGALTGVTAAAGDYIPIGDLSASDVKIITLAELQTYLNTADATFRTLAGTTNPADIATLEAGAVMYVRGDAGAAAAIEAGAELIAGVSGYQILVLGYSLWAAGAAADATGIYLQDESGTVKVSTILIGDIGDGALALPTSTNTTLGAGFGGLLTAGEGLDVIAYGSTLTGTTALVYNIMYQLVAV